MKRSIISGCTGGHQDAEDFLHIRSNLVSAKKQGIPIILAITGTLKNQPFEMFARTVTKLVLKLISIFLIRKNKSLQALSLKRLSQK